MAPDLVIMGEEIMTTRGEILALFVTEFIPPYLTPAETISKLKKQGAFIAVSHPFDPFRSRWNLQDLEELAPDLDAVEVFNAKCFSDQMNNQAAEFADQHNLAGLTGSDAHWLMELGNAWVKLPPFDSADELRAVIRQGEVQGKRSGIWPRFLWPYLKLRKKLDHRI
jgi:predicted metal-dependent phosphoesterase TrpH